MAVPRRRRIELSAILVDADNTQEVLKLRRAPFDRGLVPALSTRGVSVPSIPPNKRKGPETFSDEEIPRLFEACNHDGVGGGEQVALSMRNQALLAVLLDSGMRVSELCSVSVEGVDLERRCLRVVASKTQVRVVGLGHDRAVTMLRRYLQRARPWLAEASPISDVTANSGPLWLNRDGYPLSPEGVGELFKRLKVRAQTTGSCTPHTCRR